MRIELLYLDGCPSHDAFLPQLYELLAQGGVEVAVQQRRVESDDAAERERFLGSPTLRVNGKCRLYPTGQGLRGAPPDEWVLTALKDARDSTRADQGAGAHGELKAP